MKGAGCNCFLHECRTVLKSKSPSSSSMDVFSCTGWLADMPSPRPRARSRPRPRGRPRPGRSSSSSGAAGGAAVGQAPGHEGVKLPDTKGSLSAYSCPGAIKLPDTKGSLSKQHQKIPGVGIMGTEHLWLRLFNVWRRILQLRQPLLRRTSLPFALPWLMSRPLGCMAGLWFSTMDHSRFSRQP
jgi:hypothetical protein